MRFWRLSGLAHARALNGGYGLVLPGRWNSVGTPVTYCSTVPSLCLLEKLVHVPNRADLPNDLQLVEYVAPDGLAAERIEPRDLRRGWARQQDATQRIGDTLLRSPGAALIIVPSAIVWTKEAPDRNVLINHSSPDASKIRIVSVTPFRIDARLG
jgi:RES domain-containing protein